MKEKLGKFSVDLIYLDPPFNSKQNYNLVYRNLTGKPVPEQAEAFCDTWELDAQKEDIAKSMPFEMREHGVDEYYVKFWQLWVDALRHTQPMLLAYLIYMVQRLLYMQTVLRPTGSIYLHCDPTASHYIKIMMDGIFGHRNFRNEIVWKRTGAHSGSRRWGPVHDTILFYSVSDSYTWNKTYQDYDPSYLRKFYKQRDEKGFYQLVSLTGAGVRSGDSGKPWKGVNPSSTGRHWAVPLAALRERFPHVNPRELTTQDKLDLLEGAGLIVWPKGGSVPRQKRYIDANPGTPLQDIITDIGPISSHAQDRLGYPTQKPVTLLDRIIRASSNPGDVVFDPFCGCGTTIYSAVKNGRNWIGCDIAVLSVQIVRDQLAKRFNQVEGEHFVVDGIPAGVDAAKELFEADRLQFQHWLVERAGGFPMQKKVADRGIDGRIYFEVDGKLREMVLSVKGGATRPSDIRELRGVLERESNALIAGFLCLQEPSKAMLEEAGRAGLYEANGVAYPRIQILTVQQILEEKREFSTPSKVRSRASTAQHSFAL